MWLNPPFNKAVTTNISASFLKLVDKHFPPNNPLHKIFNRNTIKVSYSCTKNIKATIQSHNQKILNSEKPEGNTKKCNCLRSRRHLCPLKGNCNQVDAIYHATVKGDDEERKYVGSTINFKKRYYGHKASFRHDSKKHNTALASYVWDQGLGEEPEIEWAILAHAPAYSKGNRSCDLCLTEKLYISKNSQNPQYLNKRSELAQKCRHRHRHLLQTPARKGQVEEAE